MRIFDAWIDSMTEKIVNYPVMIIKEALVNHYTNGVSETKIYSLINEMTKENTDDASLDL